ncbi:unnamed protein product [Schistocephalus solidus]|uniref:Coronin n=2 Tax=Schistocephalus solidus TaxID=70667 RepID=A0A183SME3_SCHSO|nr:unnamed protein product [Schistocephalus solidus]
MQGREGEMAQDGGTAWGGCRKPELKPPAEQDQDTVSSQPGDREPSDNHEAVGDVQDGKFNPERSGDTLDDRELQTYDLVSLNSNSTYMEEEVRVTMLRRCDHEPQLLATKPDNIDDIAGNATKPDCPTFVVSFAEAEKDISDGEKLQICDRTSETSDTATLRPCSQGKNQMAGAGTEMRAPFPNTPQPGKKSTSTRETNEDMLVVHAADAMLGTEDGSTEVVAELQGGWQVSIFPASEKDPAQSKNPVVDRDQSKSCLEISQPSRLFGEELGSKCTSENEEEPEAGCQAVKFGPGERNSRELPVKQQENEQLELTPRTECGWEPPMAMEQVSIMSFSLAEDAEEALSGIGMHDHLNEKPSHSKETSAPQIKASKNEFQWESKAICKDLAKVRQLGVQELADEARDTTMMIMESCEGSPTTWVDKEHGGGRNYFKAKKNLQSHSTSPKLDTRKGTCSENVREPEGRNDTTTLLMSMTNPKVTARETNKPTYAPQTQEMCNLTDTNRTKDHLGKTGRELPSILSREDQENRLEMTEPVYKSNSKNAADMTNVLKSAVFDHRDIESQEVRGFAKELLETKPLQANLDATKMEKNSDLIALINKPAQIDEYGPISFNLWCSNEVPEEATRRSGQTDLLRKISLNEDSVSRSSEIPRTSTPNKWTQVGPLLVHNTRMTVECVSELTSLTSEGEEENDEYLKAVKSCTNKSPRAVDVDEQSIEKASKKADEEEIPQSNLQILLSLPSKDESRGSNKWTDGCGVPVECETTLFAQEALAMTSLPSKHTESPQTYVKSYDNHEGIKSGEAQTSKSTEVTRGAFSTLKTLPDGIQAESTKLQYTTLWKRMTTPLQLGHISEMTSFTSEEEHDKHHHEDYPMSQTVSTSRNNRGQEEAMLVLQSEAPSARTERASELTPLCSTSSEEKDGAGEEQSRQGGQGSGTRPSYLIGIETRSQLEQDRGTRRLDVHDPELPRRESLQTTEIEGQVKHPTPLNLSDGISNYMGTGDESLGSCRLLLKVTQPKTETSETGTVGGTYGSCGAVSQLLQRAQQCMPYERLPAKENREAIQCVSLTEGATTTKTVCGAVHVSFNHLDSVARTRQAREEYGKADSFPDVSPGLLQPNMPSKQIAAIQSKSIDWTAGTESRAPVKIEALRSRLGAKDDVVARAVADTPTATSMVREKIASGLEEIATENEVTTRCLDETFAAVWWCTPTQSVRPYTGDHKDARQGTAVLRGKLESEETTALHQIITVTLPLSTNEKGSTAEDEEAKPECSTAEGRDDDGTTTVEKLEETVYRSQQEAEDSEVEDVMLSATSAEPSDVCTAPTEKEVVRRAGTRTTSPEKGRTEVMTTVIDAERTAIEKQSRVKVTIIKEDNMPIRSSEKTGEQPGVQLPAMTASEEQQEEERDGSPLHNGSEKETPLQTAEKRPAECIPAESEPQLASRTERSRRRDALMTAIYLDGLIRDTVAALRCRPRLNRLDPANRQISCFCWRR